MPFADKYIELAHRGRELRKQVVTAREKYGHTKARDDLRVFEKAFRRYKRHLEAAQKALIESAMEAQDKAFKEAKKEAEKNKASSRPSHKRIDAQGRSFK